MKKFSVLIPLFIYFGLVLHSCKKDDAPENRPPENFTVEVTVTENTATLNWNSSTDPEGDAIHYIVILNGDTVGNNLTTTLFLLTGLEFSTSYTGEVIATDSKGAGTSSVFSFETPIGNQPPGNFTVTAKPNGNSVRLLWTVASDPDGDEVLYSVELGTSSVAQNLRGLSHTLDGLLYEKTYNGRVIATDSEGNSTEVNFNFRTGILWLQSYIEEATEFNLSYNTNNKLINIESPIIPSIDIEYNIENKVIQIGDEQISYNSNGDIHLIYRNDAAFNGLATILYDSENKITGMTANYHITGGSQLYDVVNNFIYNTQQQIVEVHENTYYHSSSSNTFLKYELTYDDNGNISNITQYSSADSIIFIVDRYISYTYDDKKNPWRQVTSQTGLPNWYLLDKYWFKPSVRLKASSIFNPCWMSPNNLLTREVIYASGDFETSTFTYTYNATSYPITAEESVAHSSGTLLTKNIEYIY